MNLNTITEIRRADPAATPEWRAGDAWLAGGTWLFSEPQPELTRLVDLAGFGWAPLEVSDSGLRIAATCTIAQLVAAELPPAWPATPLVVQCCNAFLASFKIWNAATVGGNICMALPAGPMTSLAVGLEGTYEIWGTDGAVRHVDAVAFATGNHQNVLQPGEVLRAIDLPAAALRKRTAFRRMSLTHLGRSAVLLIGTLDPNDGALLLSVTASTVRPIRLAFPAIPAAATVRQRLHEAIPDGLYHDDVHGAPPYRMLLTFCFYYFIRAELS
nr:FAD binding domain-containing protein [Chloroflexia bacterium]